MTEREIEVTPHVPSMGHATFRKLELGMKWRAALRTALRAAIDFRQGQTSPMALQKKGLDFLDQTYMITLSQPNYLL